MRTITVASTEQWQRDYVDYPPLFLVTVTAAALNDGAPLRLVPAKQDVVSGDFTYEAFALRIDLPADGDSGASQTRLSISNLGKELMPSILNREFSDASVTLRIVRADEPDIVEWQTTLRVDRISANLDVLTADLSQSPLLSTQAVRTEYTPLVAPGLFE